ncbi:MAG TPA: aminotransferase class I/II-fold pyridoxal phosphate-dependent enzyme [Candidatus Thermoplasmatota archaeon]|nr:aminotransferase class I/II-fold pyridoxal phosphate-dependent enzyme [Candidatus Thermoplasmatota archaeon]
MTAPAERSPETRAIHARKRSGNVPLPAPIHQAATFALESSAQGARYARETAPERFYTRWGNPTTRELEEALAGLEGGEAGLVTASGMGAISAAVIATMGGSGHVVAQRALYAATTELFDRVLPPFGCSVSYFEPAKPETLDRAFRSDTKLVLVETPANPTLEITDLAAVCAAARRRGVPVLCDNTFATPLNQSPLAFGCTGVLHSLTKYVGGHSDATGGAAVGPRSWIDKVWFTYKILGASPSPHEAWLLLRGLKTLGVRVARHNENAQRLAEFLERHPKVARVHYPGLKTFPQHALAARQMRGFGGMLSFELAGGHEAAARFCESVDLATLAVSLGGVETLVQHPASMTHGVLSDEERARGGVGPGLVRASVGIETFEDLRRDFEQALERA